jgi:phosphoglycolate phosphatase-like HAD superfamily hydrolase
MIHCVVFDFDGTLVDSNRIKRDAFYAVAREFRNGESAMNQIHAQSNPGDRYEVFGRFAKLLGLADEWPMKLARRYGALCARQVARCPEMSGAMAAMEALHSRGISLFVSSATPESDLAPIVDARRFRALLRGVFGEPVSKAENLRHILAISETRPRETVVVGDGVNDCEAAKQVGCHFVPVFEAPSRTVGHRQYLTDLALLPTAIDRRTSGGQPESPTRTNVGARS